MAEPLVSTAALSWAGLKPMFTTRQFSAADAVLAMAKMAVRASSFFMVGLVGEK